MLSQGIRKALSSSLLRLTRRSVGHIKNMDEENVRVLAEQIDRESSIVKTNRVYKPTYPIEFNREGEALIYSANPLKNETIYFKYPYILCTHHSIQTSPSSRSPCSTTSSTRSNWCGTGTASSCISRPSSSRLGSGTGGTSCISPTSSSCCAVEECSRLRPNPSATSVISTGRRTSS
jgi:hypothetical protein